MIIFSLISCSDDDFENYPIKEDIVTYELSANGGKLSLTSPKGQTHELIFDAAKIQMGEKIVTLYLSTDNPTIFVNQKLKDAVGYVSDDYSIYQRNNSNKVNCNIGKNATGEERTFIIEFSDGDQFTKVKLHQSK